MHACVAESADARDLKSYGLVVPVSYKHNLKLNNMPEWWNRQTQGT